MCDGDDGWERILYEGGIAIIATFLPEAIVMLGSL